MARMEGVERAAVQAWDGDLISLAPTFGKGYSIENLLRFSRISSAYQDVSVISSPLGTVTCLPTEAELAAEIQRTRALIENRNVTSAP